MPGTPKVAAATRRACIRYGRRCKYMGTHDGLRRRGTGAHRDAWQQQNAHATGGRAGVWVCVRLVKAVGVVCDRAQARGLCVCTWQPGAPTCHQRVRPPHTHLVCP